MISSKEQKKLFSAQNCRN